MKIYLTPALKEFTNHLAYEYPYQILRLATSKDTKLKSKKSIIRYKK